MIFCWLFGHYADGDVIHYGRNIKKITKPGGGDLKNGI